MVIPFNAHQSTGRDLEVEKINTMRDIKEIIGNKIAIHCTTYEEVEAIRKLVVDAESDKQLLSLWELYGTPDKIWNKYLKDSVFMYMHDNFRFSGYKLAREENYTILPAADFITPSKDEFISRMEARIEYLKQRHAKCREQADKCEDNDLKLSYDNQAAALIDSIALVESIILDYKETVKQSI